jgi:hypothetical protein
MRLWKKKTLPLKIINPPLQPIAYPNGVAVYDGQNTYYIKNNKKYRVVSDRASKSWGFTPWQGSKESLSKIPLAGILGFREGTVIKDISNGKIYLVSNNKKCHVTTPDFFEKFGIDRDWTIEVSNKEAEIHKNGEDII